MLGLTHILQRITAIILLSVAASLSQDALAQAPNFPNPIPDDNGDYAFAREVVPIMLGRKPRGAIEVKLLGDIVKLEGRDVLVKMLSKRREFYTHWSKILLDNLQVQRAGQRLSRLACYNEPMRMINGVPQFDGGALTRFIRANEPTTTATPPSGGQAYNMADLILSALQEDDLSVIMQAYLFSMGMSPGRFTSEPRARATLGTSFTHLYLTRNIGCLACHNETFSVTGPDSGWDRLFALPIGVSEALFGAAFGGDANNTFNLFHSDQRSNDPADRVLPWKIDASCVTDGNEPGTVGFRDFAPNNDAAVDFGDIAGNDKGLMDVARSLREGIGLYASDGLLLRQPVDNAPPVPADDRAAFAFQVAMTVVDHVWQNITGEKLTIALYFPRNTAQRDALWNLTETVFLAGGWSLSDLLTAILTSRYDNRRAPDNTINDSDYVLPMVIDPWVAKDPRLPDSAFSDPNDPKLSNNGQGEIIRRHHPITLLNSVSHALGWQEPLPYGRNPYPTSQLMRDIGQFWSENETGAKGIDFQTLLAWEATHGTCAKPAGVATDWIDRLLDSVAVYNADHPFRPLLLEDLVQTMKDWLVQQAEISESAAQDTGLSEIAAISAVFSTGTNLTVPLTSPTTLFGAAELEAKLRQICGVLLQTPHFLLGGISPAEPLVIPRLRVCNDSGDCTYKDMCESYRTTLASAGRHIKCLEDDVVPGRADGVSGPRNPCRILVHGGPGTSLIPRFINICDLVPDPRLECLRDAVTDPRGPGRITLDGLCRPDIPRCDPRCGIDVFAAGAGPPGGLGRDDGPGGLLGGGELGLICCGGGAGRPFDLTRPDDMLAWLEGSRILTADGVLILKRGENAAQTLKDDAKLGFGDILVLPAGASLEVESPAGIVTLSDGKMTSKSDQTTRPLDRSLLSAVERGDRIASDLLLKEGANPMAIDAQGRSALTIAAERGDIDTIQLLIRSGADIGKPDPRGMTALQAAQQGGHMRAAGLIERLGGTLGRGEVRPAAPPALMMVTGPSAATLPPVRDDKLLSTAQLRELLARGALRAKLLNLDERLSILRKHGYFGSTMTAEEVQQVNETLRKLGPRNGIY